MPPLDRGGVTKGEKRENLRMIALPDSSGPSGRGAAATMTLTEGVLVEISP
jgi:hypothetical protein